METDTRRRSVPTRGGRCGAARTRTNAAVLGLAALAGAAAALQGCRGGTAAASGAPDEKALRQAFQQKGFDINKVPPGQRAMVEGIMRSQGGPASRPGTAAGR